MLHPFSERNTDLIKLLATRLRHKAPPRQAEARGNTQNEVGIKLQ